MRNILAACCSQSHCSTDADQGIRRFALGVRHRNERFALCLLVSSNTSPVDAGYVPPLDRISSRNINS